MASFRILLSLIILAEVAFAGENKKPEIAPANANWKYDDNPNHLWNRLHRALFVRTAPDGREFLHQLDPLFWQTTRHLLTEPSHAQAITVLDEFLKNDGDKLIRDPAKRLLLQRDLWALFDWASFIADDWVRPKNLEPAALELRKRLAIAIQRLALNSEEIKSTNDNYVKAIEARAYAGSFGDKPFLPADLFDAQGPWVNFSNQQNHLAIAHTKAVSGRSAIMVFLNLPGGRKETEEYITKLGENSPDLPPGTQVAIVRRALAINSEQKIMATLLVESVQIRVFLDGDRNHKDSQAVFEFSLDRAKLFANLAGGLVPLAPNSFDFNFLQGINGGESFEPSKEGETPDPSRNLRQTMSDCLGCHGAGGAASLLSVTNAVASMKAQRERELPYFKSFDTSAQIEATIDWKHSRYEWGLLKGWLESQR